MTSPVALIAEDEPLLAEALRTRLAQAWPELRVLPVAPDGVAAIAAIAQSQPDVVFLDIAMPGASGIEVARACARLTHAPQIVFVTAFDRFALDAFEAAAVDYLLKPVEPERLARTVARVRARLASPSNGTLSHLLETLRAHLEQGVAAQAIAANPANPAMAAMAAITAITAITADEGGDRGEGGERDERGEQGEQKEGGAPRDATAAALPREYLRFVRASVGDEIRIVPVEEVCFFEAADKYVLVATADGDLLIRTSLRELLPQLDPSRFWQVHRSTVVNVAEVVSAQHTPLGRLTLKLRRRKDRVAVSRQYAHLFRQM
ncbi:response regulator transcription factor [Pandoraea nosoerga]|uniref:Transcriptional regulatory protein YehT n=2 Tax=Pandoraea TaxID=93217 RepID=A0A5E4VCP1_9BURK|nr:LytTR family DNA-binding domain-containing protein [Pandoraea nosoerga]MBN4665986.1 response regulator transcription factor [Pandoraea nosoerga]MBN4676160.1 response regulator transcription factor [Pandoraea nosoerga]MBN4681242.1 response regulator transcription factor [Pandoraea nosoerga]MBN4745270.1 response regulator transcription factor [Pandoraea nosoerga]VVE10067.1 Transcriptional regulatory protein YehT [Pandoraea nosoerga]